MAVDYDLVILGGSAAGRYAAAKASRLRARVALIEPEGTNPELTGLYHHTLIHTGRMIQSVRQAGSWGITAIDAEQRPPLQWPPVVERARQMTELIGDLDDRSLPLLAAAGVDVVVGQGVFCQPDRRSSQAPSAIRGSVRRPGLSLQVGDRLFWSHAYLLAPPTRPFVPPIAGLEAIDYLTLDSWHRWRPMLPPRLIILGGDPRAVELAQACNRLGSQVTLILSQTRLLPHEDAEASALVQAQLEAEGVNILTQTRVTQARQLGPQTWVQAGDQAIAADALLLAMGQQPDVEAWQLPVAGVQWGAQGIVVNSKLQTTHPRIYACGDGLGGYAFPHLAHYEAEIALNNALFWSSARTDYRQIPWVIFTDPELARVGFTEAQARRRYHDVQVLRQFFKTLTKAQICEETTGVCKLIVRRSGEILGAHVVGATASEWIGTIALAMQHRIRLGAIAHLSLVSPSFAEILRQLADQWQDNRRPSWQRDLLESWFDLRRSWSS